MNNNLNNLEGGHHEQHVPEVAESKAFSGPEQASRQLKLSEERLKEALIKLKNNDQSDLDYLLTMRENLVSYVNLFDTKWGKLGNNRAIYDKVKERLELLNEVLKSAAH